jgi:predicted nucleic acid-binding protein
VSYAVDVNVLLYASDEASPGHVAAARFLQSRTSDPELFCLGDPFA